MKPSKVIMLLVCLMMSEAVIADAFYYRNRTITGVGVYYTGDKSLLLFSISGPLDGKPSCAATNRMAISSSAPQYKEIVSLVMTAYATKDSKVDVYVTDSCKHWGNAQDILGVKMGDMVW